MIDRYALPEMRDVFSERRKLELWLRIELLATEALNAAGVVPDGDWERIRTALREAAVDPERRPRDRAREPARRHRVPALGDRAARAGRQAGCTLA